MRVLSRFAAMVSSSTPSDLARGGGQSISCRRLEGCNRQLDAGIPLGQVDARDGKASGNAHLLPPGPNNPVGGSFGSDSAPTASVFMEHLFQTRSEGIAATAASVSPTGTLSSSEKSPNRAHLSPLNNTNDQHNNAHETEPDRIPSV